jgi:hypothetical protein
MYCEYKQNKYIVVNDSISGLVKITSGTVQLHVKVSNVVFLKLPQAPIVSHKGLSYIRTVKGHIFSLATGRLMKWGVNNGDRKNILSAE